MGFKISIALLCLISLTYAVNVDPNSHVITTSPVLTQKYETFAHIFKGTKLLRLYTCIGVTENNINYMDPMLINLFVNPKYKYLELVTIKIKKIPNQKKSRI